MRINNNPLYTSSLNYCRINKDLESSIQKLSSGLRINFSWDDAAGLAVGTRLSARIQGFQQSLRNLQDGYSMLQVADGGLQETTDLLQRLRTLAVQASNGTLTSEDRLLIQEEFSECLEEIDRSAESVTFNGIELLTGYINWKDLETDPTKQNVADAALIGDGVYGEYKVHLDTKAVAQEQTSNTAISSHQRDTFTTAFGGTATAGTQTKSNDSGAGEITASGSIDYNFGEIVEQLNYLKNSNNQFLTEGTDYTYNEINNDVQLIETAKTVESYTATGAGGNITANAGTNTITVDKIISNFSGIDINNINGGAAGKILVNDMAVTGATIGNGKIINETEVVETYAVNGDTQTVQAGGVVQLDNVGNLNGADAIDLTGLTTNLDDLTITGGAVSQENATVTNEVITNCASYTDPVYKFTREADTTNGTVSNVSQVSVDGGSYATNLVGSVSDILSETGNANYYIDGDDIYIHGDQAFVDGDTISYRVDVAHHTITAADWKTTKLDGTPLAANVYRIDLEGDYYFGSMQKNDVATQTALSNAYSSNDPIFLTANGDFTVDPGGSPYIYVYNDGGNSWDLDISYKAKITETISVGGNTVKEADGLSSFTVAGSNNGGDNITSADISCAALTTKENNLADVDAAGDYYIDAVNGRVFTFSDVNGQTVSYETDYNFTNLTTDLANKEFTINSENNAAGATVSATVGQDITYLNNVTYKDGKYETVKIAPPVGASAIPDFHITAISDTLNGAMTEGVDFTVAADGTLTYIGTNGGFDTDLSVNYTYDAAYDISTYDAATGLITVNDLGGSPTATKLGDIAATKINDITYNTIMSMEASYFNLNEDPITSPNSILVSETADSTNFYNGYTLEGKSLKLTVGGDLDVNSDGIADSDFTIDYAYNSNGTAINLDLVTQLGESVSGDADNYNLNSGLFNDFTSSDQISFSVDGRNYNITVNPTDTIQDVIDAINIASDNVYDNLDGASSAYMNSGTGNNAGIWASWDAGNQEIIISSRNDADTKGYSGSRFNITVNDAEIGPGNYLNFAESTASVDPTITITDPGGVSYTTTSSDGSNFFNNTLPVSGMPGMRVQIKEDAAQGTESRILLESITLQTGPDAGNYMYVSLIDMRAAAIGVTNISVDTMENAQNAITALDSALNSVAEQRSRIGSWMNRIEYSLNSVDRSDEPLTSAKSKIMDTDMAIETVEYTKNKLLENINIDFIIKEKHKLATQLFNIIDPIT